MGRVGGVDGCKAGWICVTRSPRGDDLGSTVARTADDLAELAATLEVVAIDIPIGLPESGVRSCDREARRLLGRPRGSSVFPAPVRAALAATNREEASRITAARDGRKVGAQAWAIVAKVRQVDELLQERPELRGRFREVHPEVSFRALNGSRPVAASKRTLDGMTRRLDLVTAQFGPAAFRQVRDAWPHGAVGDDDILDALALLWTAERIASGTAVTLPACPPTDTTGLGMEIVY